MPAKNYKLKLRMLKTDILNVMVLQPILETKKL